VRAIDRIADDGARRAIFERLGDEAMAVGRLAFQRDEEVAGTDFAGIESDAIGAEGALHFAVGGFGYVEGGPEGGHWASPSASSSCRTCSGIHQAACLGACWTVDPGTSPG